MVQYLKTKRRYFYKLFKNGKKKRITQNEYKKTKTRKYKHDLIGGNGDTKILIYCHNRIVDLTRANTNHWQGPIFKQLLTERGIDPMKIKVDTIDIVPGGTIVADGFSKSFIDSHENEFDIVILPDCGGLWIEFQKEHNDENFQRLKSSISENKIYWVKDVKGIHQAHTEAAKQVSTDMFYVVDADAYILP